MTEQDNPKIAEQDIVAYKVLDRTLHSYYYGHFKWELGKEECVYMQLCSAHSLGVRVVHEGLHAFKSLEQAKEWAADTVRAKLGVRLVEVVIPTWAEYYEGKDLSDNDCITSNEMKATKVL